MGLCWSLVVELRVLFSSRNCYRHLCLFKQDFVEAEKTPGKIMNEMTSFFFPSVFFFLEWAEPVHVCSTPGALKWSRFPFA